MEEPAKSWSWPKTTLLGVFWRFQAPPVAALVEDRAAEPLTQPHLKLGEPPVVLRHSLGLS